MNKTIAPKIGTIVQLPARADGVEHRDGNEALWEIVALQLDGKLATLHLVGAAADRTCGAATKNLIIVEEAK